MKKVVLIGDSITDCGRREDPENLGSGYVRLIHDYFVTAYPNEQIQFINKGISGNRITDLAARWQGDVIDLNPDYVSISIGINDVWRQLDRPEIEQVGTELFQKLYIDLLTQLKEKTNEVIGFCSDVGLPITLKQLGVEDASPANLKKAVEICFREGSFMKNLSFEATPQLVADAIVGADALGLAFGQ